MPTISSVGPIAVDVVGGLNGDGTVCHPLGVNVDGTSVSINADNQITSPTSVALGGGITGDGTPGNPLAIDVDGVTVKIVNDVLESEVVVGPGGTNGLVGAGTPISPLAIDINTANNGGLDGDGTLANPLKTSIDGTTITCTANLLTAHTLIAGVGSALTGDGTSGNPLSVNVDNTTIKIAAGKLSTIALGLSAAQISLTNAQLINIFATPVQIVAPQAGKLIIPVLWLFTANKPSSVAVTPATNFRLSYHNVSGPGPFTDMPMGFDIASAGVTGGMRGNLSTSWNTGQANLTGLGLDVTSPLDISGTFPPIGITATVTLMYIVG